MGSGKLPSILHELLEPAPRLLCLFNWGLPLRTWLVLGEFWADQVQHQGDSLPDLYTVHLPRVPVFDQVLDMLLGIGLEHYDKFQKKGGGESTADYDNKESVIGEVKTDLTSQLPVFGLQLLANLPLAF